jgi:cytochrome c oxidase subunit III
MSDIALRRLPIGAAGRRANGWWGALTVICTEGALFGFLLFTYYYVAVQNGRDWLPDKLPEFRLSGPDTILLIVSSIVVWRGEAMLKQGGRNAASAVMFGLGAALGAIFVVVQYFEWMNKDFGIATNSYGSLYFTITGFHMAHVIVGVLVLLCLTLWTALGYFDRRRNAAVSAGALYWHFVDAVWIAIFFTIYVTPRLNVG